MKSIKSGPSIAARPKRKKERKENRVSFAEYHNDDSIDKDDRL